MRKVLLAFLLAAVGCRTPEDMQRDYAHRLAPAQFAAPVVPDTAPAPAPNRKLLVRVYLDDDYRVQLLHAEERMRRQFERASEVLGPSLGVELVVVDVRPWNHRARADLGEAVDALAELDKGDDVDWVVGFASPLPAFSGTMDQLGMARVYGKHAVLRGIENTEEHDAITANLDKISDAERDSLYRQLQLHKETAVLLHELGHCIGAWHTRELDYLMSATYDRHSVSFAPESIEAMQVGLRHFPRGAKPGPERDAWAKELAALADQRKDAWQANGIEQVKSFAGDRTASASAPADDPNADRLHGAEISDFNAGRDALLKHDSMRARPLLMPLASKHPRNADVASLVCYLLASEPSPGDEARAQCRKAAGMPEQKYKLDILLQLSRIELSAKDYPAALSDLAKANAELAAAPDAAAQQWLNLGDMYFDARALSAAEDAFARAGDGGKPMLGKITSMRRWLGVPRVSTMPADQESTLVFALAAAQSDIDAGRFDRATPRVDALLRKNPRSPGALALHCMILGQARQTASARKACEDALQVQADCLQAEMLLVQLEHNRPSERKRLEHVLALDPTFEFAYRRLSQVYENLGAGDELAQLKSRYKARFGREL